MYGTTELPMANSLAAGSSFSVYVSTDLENFEGPFVVFDGKKENFWGTCDYWAPELHVYNGKSYLFGSFKADGKNRATQILMADNPLGPFKPISDKPQTPEEDMCLDGTLWVEDGTPYLVYCHEWVQIYDGEICAVRLSDDLSKPVGKPFKLFKASDNPFAYHIRELNGNKCYVTDGPFLIKNDGKINLIWSSFDKDLNYVILTAEADTITGEWKHLPPKYNFDGGHSMIFTDLNGKEKISFHAPNEANKERAQFLDIE
jgi:GH43 family beta-xylosidase